MEFNATFIVSAVSFIFFIIIMNAILYKPLSKIVQERNKFVDDHYKEASWAKEKATSLLNNKEKKLETTRHDAKKIIAEKSDAAKQQKNSMAQEAQKTSQEIVSKAKEELQQSKQEAQDILSNKVVELAQGISAKFLGENISIDNIDKDVIDKIIKS